MGKTPMTYFSSDWHFGHENIIKFERTNFDNVQDHDSYLIETLKSWSEKWAPGSVLWFLGDFGNLDYLWVFDKFAHNGITINFILGNHDKVEDIPKIQMYCDNVYEYPLFLSQKLVISHFPVAVYGDSINIHGHLHGAKLRDKNHINASIHVANYNPITSKQLAAIYSQIPKFNRRFLYEPYAADHQFTQPKDDAVMDKDGCIDLSASRVLMNLKYGPLKKEFTEYAPYVGGI